MRGRSDGRCTEGAQSLPSSMGEHPKALGSFDGFQGRAKPSLVMGVSGGARRLNLTGDATATTLHWRTRFDTDASPAATSATAEGPGGPNDLVFNRGGSLWFSDLGRASHGNADTAGCVVQGACGVNPAG